MLGPQQIDVLRAVHAGGWLDASDNNALYRVCLRLHGRRLLARDPRSWTRFTSTADGDALIERHDAALEQRRAA